MRFFILLCLLLPLSIFGQQRQHVIGTVSSSLTRQPLPGATVAVKGSALKVKTNAEGKFKLDALSKSFVLVISYLGYFSQEISVGAVEDNPILVYLTETQNLLDEVIVSTGYEQVSKNLSTGSFVQLDTEILNRRVSTDVLSRLEDVTSGLIFNRNRGAGENNLSIRGRTTLFANSQPLIVLDNFPYEGDIGNINPNDIESITVLKDAAAASIWGSRAGNGVIVINTKRGKFNQNLNISFKANATSSQKPNLFYQPKMSISAFIDMEKVLFDKGYYKTIESSSNKAPLSPVVELLIAQRDKLIDDTEAQRQIEVLKGYDVRNDYERYLYRNGLNQQYALSMQGGSSRQRFSILGGYDHNNLGLQGNSYTRTSINTSHTYSIVPERLEFTAGLLFTQSLNTLNNIGTGRITMGNTPVYPYARLADENGKALSIVHDYRIGFIESLADKGLLDWQYRPLEEIDLAENTIRIRDLKFNASLKYSFLSVLSGEVLYQFGSAQNKVRNHQSLESYSTRNLINQFAQPLADGGFTFPIPKGSVLDQTGSEASSHNFRAQLNLNTHLGKEGRLTAIGGYELRQHRSITAGSRHYGYDNEHASSSIVDFINPYKYYYSSTGATGYIRDSNLISDLQDINISYYLNAVYTLRNKYTLSASGRLDQSNLFGVQTNQKGVPLYSAGASWTIHQEDFWQWEWFPYFRLRASYGYSGNIDKTLSAYTTAVYNSGTIAYSRLPYAVIANPPNPELRWERVRIVNAALDFELKGGILGGSIDLYSKKGIDLIGKAPFPTSSGIRSFKGNTANTSGKGIDVVLNAKPINGQLKWVSNLLFSYGEEKVDKYAVVASASNYLNDGEGSSYPMMGKPLSAVYSYRWAGLSPQAGDPIGYLNGEESKEYSKIVQAATPENIIYNGSAKPIYYGSFRNTLTFGKLSVSAALTYRLGYYFRKQSISYDGVLAGRGGHGDYHIRWQQPGDEILTSVPSMPAVVNINRDRIYTYSEILVEKGDHIRLQDLTASYRLERKKESKAPFKAINFHLYANHLGLIWRANRAGIDPDYQTMPLPFTLSVGLKIEF